jgi:hypothetical protein
MPGALWAVYDAGSFTNVSGVTVPLRFTFTAYEPLKEISHPENRSPVFKVEGSVDSARATVTGDLLDPTFHGVAVVDDFRVAAGRNEWRLTYKITNSAAPLVSSPLITFLKDRKLSLFKVSKAPLGWAKANSRLIFAAMALFVSAAFVRVIITKTTKQKG